MDLAIDPETGDLALTETGNIPVVSGKDAIVQHVKVRLRFLKGECAFDLRLGFPWRQEVLVKRPNLARIRSLVRQAIETTPGIETVNELDLTHDRRARTLAIRFRATTTELGVIDSAEYGPFVLEAP